MGLRREIVINTEPAYDCVCGSGFPETSDSEFDCCYGIHELRLFVVFYVLRVSRYDSSPLKQGP
jgi:hypothetical protein